MADEAILIGPPAVAKSYIDIERVVDAVRKSGADAVHPGYGFLSENSSFAQALEAEGVAFIGPPTSAIEAMGDKLTSKQIAAEAGVSTVPGHDGSIEGPEQALKIARSIGYPVMIKASAGGGGKGMRIAFSEDELLQGLQSARHEARSSFGDDRILFEKFVSRPRHIEIQVLADTHGNCIHLNERECSIQRRNQKVIEEAPSPFLDPATRQEMAGQAVELAKAVGYCSAGTVEFIVDENRQFYFLEMNTRLQVEHPVTELITGIDLVEQMIRVAAGDELQYRQEDIPINGWAIESRIYAEDPFHDFLPSIGRLTRYRPPEECKGPECAVRNDTGVFEGGEISIHYDPMIAKLCSWGADRESAIDVMRGALDEFEIEGIKCNLPFLSAVMDHGKFVAGDLSTAFIEEEFPDGFAGVEPSETTARHLASAAAWMHELLEQRRHAIGGAKPPDFAQGWFVTVASTKFRLNVEYARGLGVVHFEDGHSIEVITDWDPTTSLASFRFDGEEMILKTDRLTGGFRIRHRGVDVKVDVRTPRQDELGEIVAAIVEESTVGQLTCPMPGVMVSFAVSEGDEVAAGQALCTVEAMKMENVLKAERKAVVTKILPSPGDTLAVGDVIMELD